jgi:hypothetical protein
MPDKHVAPSSKTRPTPGGGGQVVRTEQPSGPERVDPFGVTRHRPGNAQPASDVDRLVSEESGVGRDIVLRLEPDVYRILQEIATKKGVPLEQVLIDALDLEVTYHEIQAAGGRLLVEQAGEVRELTPA